MDIKKLILIVALVVTSIVILRQWNSDYHGKAARSSSSDAAISSEPSHLPSTSSHEDQKDNDAPVIDTGSPSHNKETKVSDLISVKTDTLAIKINLKGGDIVQSLLLKYPKYQGNPDIPFQILQDDTSHTYIAQSGLVGKDGIDAKGDVPLYRADHIAYQLSPDRDKVTVDLHYNERGVDFIKRYTLKRGDYEINVQYVINNQSSKDWQGNFYAQLKRDGSEDPSHQAGATSFNSFLGAAFRSKDKRYEKLKFDDFAKEPFNQEVKGGYAAIVQHYFLSAWVPDQGKTYHYLSRIASNGNYIIGFIDKTVDVKPGETITLGARLYSGPKLQGKLVKLADGLDLTVDYGILWWLAQPLFKLLNFIHSIVGNWGWAIIFLTVLVKLVLFPLSAKAYRSMANMRKVGPKIQSLKEQYSDDRQQLGQAMMKLYKKEKINPMGGCFPMLLQMPVFLSLYWVLQESVELRQAPWILWIIDLSQKDPYFILPLVMGFTMFIQQMLNPTPPDPMQAKVMKFMPVVFTLFFLWFPAGLVLYWIVNNTLSIAQQWVITRKLA